MRILGIDYGEKRVGLAVSDESQTIAREFEILSPKEFWANLQRVIQEQGIEKIVLGWPLNMKGEETEKTKEVGEFRAKLSARAGLPVEIMDERLTSEMAQKIGGVKKNLDSLAAQIILQNYLDKTKSN